MAQAALVDINSSWVRNSKQASYIQTSFIGGMNLFIEPTDLAANQYGLAFNVRNRKNSLTCANNYSIDSLAPAGLLQGLYPVGEFYILFANGLGYYKLRDTAGWTQIENFAMSPTVNNIYCQLVPESSTVLQRVLDETANNIQGTALVTNMLVDNTQLAGNIAGLVCQDGENQPWIIDSDFEARELQTYDEWTLDSREYVPIGTLMCYVNGKLFVVDPNGTSIYQSVSGRPIDFVINVGTDGNKGGDATTTYYAVSSQPMTSFQSLSTGQILASNATESYIISFNYSILIFGEPTYSNVPIEYGIINQFSVAPSLGDFLSISSSGSVRSFNAVEQENNEGRNSILSLAVSTLFNNIAQNNQIACCGVFDNYVLFSVQTTYGQVVLVFDQLLQVWVSIDTVGNLPIKQFATMLTGNMAPELLAITNNQVIQMFVPNTYAIGIVQLPVYATGDPMVELKMNKVLTVFGHEYNPDTITVTASVNYAYYKRLQQPLNIRQGGITFPALYPVTFNTGELISNLSFQFLNFARTGYVIGAQISWNSDARLICLESNAETVERPASQAQQSQQYNVNN